MAVGLNTQTPYQLVAAGSEAGIISNRDTINSVLLASTYGECFDGASSFNRVIDPLGWVRYNGRDNIWGIALTGTPVVDIHPGSTFLSTLPKAYDTRLDTTAPLSSLAAGVGPAIPLYDGKITGYAYNIDCDFMITSGALTSGQPPFIKLSFLWKNAKGGVNLPVQHYFLLTTDVSPGNANTQVAGKGPCEGAYLTILVKNMNATDAMTFDFQFWQNYRTVPGHVWQSISNNISSTMTYNGYTFSTPSSDSTANILGITNDFQTVAAGATLSRINALYTGQASLTVIQQAVTTIQTLDITVTFLDPELTYNSGLNIIKGNVFHGISDANGNLYQPQVPLPNLPCLVNIKNTGSSSTTVFYSLVAGAFKT